MKKNSEFNLMNATASSWTDENLNNDFIKYHKENNFTDEFIGEGKYECSYKRKTKDGKIFFKKPSVSNQYEMLICNAFLSTFTHTPYLIAYDEPSKAFIWHYDEKKTQIDKKDDKKEVFFNYNGWFNGGCLLKKEELYSEENFCNLPLLLQKNALQLLVQQFFFSMWDRKSANLIFKEDRLSHIDIDSLLFSNDNDVYTITKKLMCLFNTIIKDKPSLSEHIEAQINKIIDIDWSIVIDRYIRNCLIAKVDKYAALAGLENFLYRLNDFIKNNPLITKEDQKEFKDNNIYKVLYEGFQQFSQKFSKNLQIQELLNDSNRDCIGEYSFNDTKTAQWFLKKFEQQKKKWVYNKETAEKYILKVKEEKRKKILQNFHNNIIGCKIHPSNKQVKNYVLQKNSKQQHQVDKNKQNSEAKNEKIMKSDYKTIKLSGNGPVKNAKCNIKRIKEIIEVANKNKNKKKSQNKKSKKNTKDLKTENKLLI